MKTLEPTEHAMTDSQNPARLAADFPAPDPVHFQRELTAQKNNYLLLAADFANFKKRTQRDAERQAAAQKEAFIVDLLPTLDNLERALASKHSTHSDPLRQGVAITLQQLSRLLRCNGIEAVEATGLPFDPHRHEAVAVGHDPLQPDQIILEVTQRGYCRGDKVFRPAKVIVNDLYRSSGVHHAG